MSEQLCPGCRERRPRRNRRYCSPACVQAARVRTVRTLDDLQFMALRERCERQPAKTAAVYLIWQPKAGG